MKIGNSTKCNMVGTGDVYMNMNTATGCKLHLKDIRHVLKIDLNLIFDSTLDDMGYHILFSESKWKLTKESLVVAIGKKHSSLYMTETKSYRGEVNTIDNSSVQI